jgi:hypothetical protein
MNTTNDSHQRRIQFIAVSVLGSYRAVFKNEPLCKDDVEKALHSVRVSRQDSEELADSVWDALGDLVTNVRAGEERPWGFVLFDENAGKALFRLIRHWRIPSSSVGKALFEHFRSTKESIAQHT